MKRWNRSHKIRTSLYWSSPSSLPALAANPCGVPAIIFRSVVIGSLQMWAHIPLLACYSSSRLMWNWHLGHLSNLIPRHREPTPPCRCPTKDQQHSSHSLRPGSRDEADDRLHPLCGQAGPLQICIWILFDRFVIHMCPPDSKRLKKRD